MGGLGFGAGYFGQYALLTSSQTIDPRAIILTVADETRTFTVDDEDRTMTVPARATIVVLEEDGHQ